jgi:hypothetical protein
LLCRLEKALATYQEMKAADVKPDCVVFNTLLSAAERAKNPGKALVSEPSRRQ